eukprot:scaffold140454_cov32-Tisochrysis_lutea.AAC.1
MSLTPAACVAPMRCDRSICSSMCKPLLTRRMERGDAMPGRYPASCSGLRSVATVPAPMAASRLALPSEALAMLNRVTSPHLARSSGKIWSSRECALSNAAAPRCSLYGPERSPSSISVP